MIFPLRISTTRLMGAHSHAQMENVPTLLEMTFAKTAPYTVGATSF